MDLYQQIELDIKTSLKGGDSKKLSVLRMVLAAIKMVEIEKNVKRASIDDVIKVIQRQIKQHKESITQFEKGQRADLVAKETEELKILESYMPEQLSAEEILKIAKESVAEAGATTKSELGKVMKIAIEKAKGRADGKALNQAIAGLLK